MTRDNIKSPEFGKLQERKTPSRPFLAQILFCVGLSFPIGGLAALLADGLDEGFGWFHFAGALVFFTIGVAAIRYAIRVGNFEPPTFGNSAGVNQIILLGSVLLGASISLYLILSGRIDDILDENFTLTTLEALGAFAIIALALVPSGYFWHKNVDEHDAAAAKSGALLALYTYIYAYMIWGIGAAAQLLPPVNDLALFLLVVFTFIGRWAYKRSG